MKQGLIVLTLLMALSVSVPTLAQKHRHTPQGTELVDTTHNSSAVDAFSDTTTVDTVAGSNSRTFHYEWDSDNDEDVEKLLSWMDSTVEKHTWAAWTIAIIVIIFVFLLFALTHHLHYPAHLAGRQEPQAEGADGTDGNGEGTAYSRPGVAAA